MGFGNPHESPLFDPEVIIAHSSEKPGLLALKKYCIFQR